MKDYPPLQMSRTFDAPRQAVWDAWTQPDQFLGGMEPGLSQAFDQLAMVLANS